MSEKIYARRYAQAVFEIAQEKNELDAWQVDLDKVSPLGLDATIVAVMENPKLPFEDKVKLVSDQLRDISTLALNLIYLLVSKNRFYLIYDIAEEYRRLLDRYRGIEEATVITAIPLIDEDKAKLNRYLAAVSGKKIVLESEVNPSLMGGVVAHIGGKLLDGSTRSRLEALKKEITGSGV